MHKHPLHMNNIEEINKNDNSLDVPDRIVFIIIAKSPLMATSYHSGLSGILRWHLWCEKNSGKMVIYNLKGKISFMYVYFYSQTEINLLHKIFRIVFGK